MRLSAASPPPELLVLVGRSASVAEVNGSLCECGEQIVLLADELNRLAMAVDLLAGVTPWTEAGYAVEARRKTREMAKHARDQIAELIPE